MMEKRLNAPTFVASYHNMSKMSNRNQTFIKLTMLDQQINSSERQTTILKRLAHLNRLLTIKHLMNDEVN